MTTFSNFQIPYQGKLPVIASDAWIAHSAIVIGNVEIGSESNIWHHVTIRGDVNTVRIGARTNIQDGCVVHVTRPEHAHKNGGGRTWIGSDITIGHLALIHACELQDHSFVGMKAMVMDGAIIESYGMLAAGSLLPPGKIIGSRQLWMGNPARYVRHLSDEEITNNAKNAEEYRQLAKRYQSI